MKYHLGLTAVFMWAIYNVFARYVGLEGAHPVVFVCFGFIVSSMVLLVAAGPGRFSVSSFRSPVTWLYGVFALLEHVFTVYLFIYLSSAEGSLLQRFGVILSVLLAWLFFSRVPSKTTAIGLAFVSAGCVWLLSELDVNHVKHAICFLSAAILFQVLKTMVIEAHPEIVAQRTMRQKIRVTAMISFVTSTLLFMVMALVAAYGYALDIDVSPLPTVQDFASGETLILGGVFGLFIEPLSIYAYFYAVRALKSERFMALAALVPLFTYIIEAAAAPFTGIQARVFSETEWLCLALITFGSAVMQMKRKKKPTPQLI